MNPAPQRVWMLVLANGSCLVEDWLVAEIRDTVTRARLMRQIDKLQRGLFGDWKPTRGSVCELRIDLGPGYRVYYARHGRTQVVTILGGDKSTQDGDIKRAEDLWDAFLKAGAPSDRPKAWGEE